MNNKPVAWIQTWQNQDGELKRTVNIEQIGKQDIPLYTAEQLEEARKLGMQQERALWNLSESTQEIMNTHPVKELTDEEILQQAEFMFGTYFFESIDDPYWIEFARAILRKAQEK